MVYKKKHHLKDGSEVLFEQLTGKEDARQFQLFINTFYHEGAYLLRDKPATLQEEKQWLKHTAEEIRSGRQLFLKAMVDNYLIGCCNAQRGMFREQGNVMLGIAVEKRWRQRGIGRLLLQEIILLVEQKWQPQNIYLTTVVTNRPAQALFSSIGFKLISRLPYWFCYNGMYYDEFMLLLDKQEFYKRMGKIKTKEPSPLLKLFKGAKRVDQ